MQNPLKSWDNLYKITYKDHSYFQMQWEVYLLVHYMTDTGPLWNEKVTRLVSGEKFEWQLNAENKLPTIGTNLDLPSSCSIPKVVGILPLRNPAPKSKEVNFFSRPNSSGSDSVRWLLPGIFFGGDIKRLK